MTSKRSQRQNQKQGSGDKSIKSTEKAHFGKKVGTHLSGSHEEAFARELTVEIEKRKSNSEGDVLLHSIQGALLDIAHHIVIQKDPSVKILKQVEADILLLSQKVRSLDMTASQVSIFSGSLRKLWTASAAQDSEGFQSLGTSPTNLVQMILPCWTFSESLRTCIRNVLKDLKQDNASLRAFAVKFEKLLVLAQNQDPEVLSLFLTQGEALAREIDHPEFSISRRSGFFHQLRTHFNLVAEISGYLDFDQLVSFRNVTRLILGLLAERYVIKDWVKPEETAEFLKLCFNSRFALTRDIVNEEIDRLIQSDLRQARTFAAKVKGILIEKEFKAAPVLEDPFRTLEANLADLVHPSNLLHEEISCRFLEIRRVLDQLSLTTLEGSHSEQLKRFVFDFSALLSGHFEVRHLEWADPIQCALCIKSVWENQPKLRRSLVKQLALSSRGPKTSESRYFCAMILALKKIKS